MNYKIDKNHEKYKQYRLRLAADNIKKAKILPNSFMDIVKPDPGTIQTMPEPIVYRCRKCRRVVACRSNLVTHKPKDDPLINIENLNIVDNSPSGFGEGCSDVAATGPITNSDNTSKKSSEQEIIYCKKMFFVEPIAWMKDIISNTQGRLHCPKCSSKLGNFSWVMGCQCPCGHQVSPAFYLVPSRVEYSTVVQNVQVTV